MAGFVPEINKLFSNPYFALSKLSESKISFEKPFKSFLWTSVTPSQI